MRHPAPPPDASSGSAPRLRYVLGHDPALDPGVDPAPAVPLILIPIGAGGDLRAPSINPSVDPRADSGTDPVGVARMNPVSASASLANPPPLFLDPFQICSKIATPKGSRPALRQELDQGPRAQRFGGSGLCSPSCQRPFWLLPAASPSKPPKPLKTTLNNKVSEGWISRSRKNERRNDTLNKVQSSR